MRKVKHAFDAGIAAKKSIDGILNHVEQAARAQRARWRRAS